MKNETQREFPLFVDTYHELRAEGLPFSEQYQSDRPPVLDPGGGSLLDRPSAGSGTRGRPESFAESARSAALVGGGARAVRAAAETTPPPSPAKMHELSGEFGSRDKRGEGGSEGLGKCRTELVLGIAG